MLGTHLFLDHTLPLSTVKVDRWTHPGAVSQAACFLRSSAKSEECGTASCHRFPAPLDHWMVTHETSSEAKQLGLENEIVESVLNLVHLLLKQTTDSQRTELFCEFYWVTVSQLISIPHPCHLGELESWIGPAKRQAAQGDLRHPSLHTSDLAICRGWQLTRDTTIENNIPATYEHVCSSLYISRWTLFPHTPFGAHLIMIVGIPRFLLVTMIVHWPISKVQPFLPISKPCQ